MKAYVLDAVNELNYKDIELRKLSAGEALVEVKAAGICESDIPRIFTTGTYHFPTIPGHEFSGVVVDVNLGDLVDENRESWIGKRVGVFPLIPCMECTPCTKHQYEMCEHYSYLGSRTDGGFAEYVITPIWNLIELPDEVKYEEAAMLEPSAVALHAVRRTGIDPLYMIETHMNQEAVRELRVLIIGLGTVAGVIAQWLAIAGIKNVVATCHHDEHGQLMQKIASCDYKYVNTNSCSDASDIFVENTYDIVFDCVNNEATVSEALRCVTPGGQIILVGNPHGDMQLDKNLYWKILRKQIRLAGTWNSTFNHSKEDDWNGVLAAIANGNLKLEPMITHKLPFDSLKEGLLIKKDKTEFCNKVMGTVLLS